MTNEHCFNLARRIGLPAIARHAARPGRAARHLRRRLRRLLAYGSRPQCRATTIAIRWRFPATDEGLTIMTLFRNVVFIAALAGLLAGIVHDRHADLRHRSADPAGRDLRERRRAGARPCALRLPKPTAAGTAAAAAPHTSMTRKPGRRPTASSASPITALANVVSGIGFALVLVAVSEFAGGIASWRQGAVLGLCRLCRVHAGARPRPAAGTAGHARRRLVARQVWWIGDGASRPRPGWR